MVTVTENVNEANETKIFIESMGLPEVAKTVLRNLNDCNIYLEMFHDKKERVLQNLTDFRQYMISKSSVTLSIFLEMCCRDKKSAFESTFYQVFTLSEMQFMEDFIDSGKLTLTSLYEKFIANPKRNIIRHFK